MGTRDKNQMKWPSKGKVYSIKSNARKDLLYDGEFVNGQMSGYGISYYDDPGEHKEYKGKFSKNQRHDDRGMMFYESGQIKSIAKWVNNNVEGEAIAFYESGNIEHVGYRHNGHFEGSGLLFRDDDANSVFAYGQFKKGELDGIAITYDDYENIKSAGRYKRGEFVGGYPTDNEITKAKEEIEKLIMLLFDFRETVYEEYPELRPE